MDTDRKPKFNSLIKNNVRSKCQNELLRCYFKQRYERKNIKKDNLWNVFTNQQRKTNHSEYNQSVIKTIWKTTSKLKHEKHFLTETNYY